MDDLSFRRRLLAEPKAPSAEIEQSCRDDKSKADYREALLQFEGKLEATLNISTPDNLAENLLLSQSLQFTKQKRKTHQFWFSLAACFCLILVIAIQKPSLFTTYDSIEEYSLAHLHAELNHMHHDGDFQQADLNLKLAHFGVELTEQLGKVKFANFCDFNGIQSLHLVFQEVDRLVTVFILPKNNRLLPSVTFTDQRYKGSSVIFNEAQLVIISDDTSLTNKWQHKLTTRLKTKRFNTV